MVSFCFSLCGFINQTVGSGFCQALEAGTGDFKTVLPTQSTDAPRCFLAQVPSFQGHRLVPSLEQANKTGGKACVHSVASSLIHVVTQKQMSWVLSVYQALGRVYLDESWDGTLPSMGSRDKGSMGMAEAVMLVCNE